MSNETELKRVFSHPAYLAHALDGEIVRICLADGDIYIGEPSEDGGINIEQGTMLMNPNRTLIDCADKETTPVLMTSDEFKDNERAIQLAIETLDHAHTNPDMVLNKDTGRAVYEKWIHHAQQNHEKHQKAQEQNEG